MFNRGDTLHMLYVSLLLLDYTPSELNESYFQLHGIEFLAMDSSEAESEVIFSGVRDQGLQSLHFLYPRTMDCCKINIDMWKRHDLKITHLCLS